MLGLWLLARDGRHFNPLRQGAPLMLARGALVYCTAMMFFLALKDLDLGTVTTLLFFYPVVATVIAAVFLREPIGLWRGLAVVLGFVGVVVAVQPGGDLFHPSSFCPYVRVSVLRSIRRRCDGCHARFQLKIPLRPSWQWLSRAHRAWL